MLNVTKELTALARKLGYTGTAPDTVAKAINAITSVAGEGGGSGDGCDCEPGYEVVETQLFSETVTTSAVEGQPAPLGTFAYASPIEAPSLTVTFDDSVYTVPVIEIPMGNMYGEVSNGGPDFSTYPFLIGSNYGGNTIYTETAGAHTVTVATSILQTSDDFAAAVNSVMGGIFNITATVWDDSVNGYILDKTAAQIKEACANGQLCLITGGIPDTRANVLFGTLITIESTIVVDVTNNQLILTKYDLDAQTNVVSGTDYLYTLTPATQ